MQIKTDSREVKPGDTFVAIQGFHQDGHDFIKDALQRGATKIVTSKHIDCIEEVCIVEEPQKYLQDYLVENYSKQINSLKIIGITGTNGKTTTCYLVYQMLQALGVHVAYIGTLGYITKNNSYKLKNTTPDILTLYNLLLQAKEDNCQIVIMEVSSHGLVQGRLHGIKLSYAGFTNLSLDHLDYHETMEKYLLAKLKILDILKEDGKCIVNMDDPLHDAFMKKAYIGFGYNGKEYTLVSYYCHHEQTRIEFIADAKYQVTIPLLGKFNVYNYLMAVAFVRELGYAMEDILEVSRKLVSPVGRCTIVPLNNGNVVIDYAHTPDAVLKMITNFKEDTLGRIITVVGCGGERDSSKRPVIGKITTLYSNFVFFTDDNPRSEDSMQILKDIEQGVVNNNYIVIPNRKEAINKAILLMKKDDTILLLGKGHEEYQIIGDKTIAYSDIDEVKKYA